MIKDMLIRDEGNVSWAYQDSEGYWTIGVGRLIDKRKGGGLSEDEIMYLLENDIKRSTAEAEKFTWFYDLNAPRQAVIISMLFNMGLPTFKQFKRMIMAIEKGDFWQASHEMMDSKWADQVGPRADRLSTMMETGEWQ